MASAKRPTDEDHREAVRIALSGIASGTDLAEMMQSLEPLHPKNNSFPGEVLLELAADALELGGINRQQPIEYEGIRQRYLPEHEFRGKAAHHHSHFALRAVPMIVAGVTPDLLDEMGWQQTDDLWVWSLYALVIYVRAAAEHGDVSVAELATRLAGRHSVDLTTASR